MGVTADYLQDQFEKSNMIEDFRATLLQEKVYTFLQEHAVITEEDPPAEESGEELETKKE